MNEEKKKLFQFEIGEKIPMNGGGKIEGSYDRALELWVANNRGAVGMGGTQEFTLNETQRPYGYTHTGPYPETSLSEDLSQDTSPHYQSDVSGYVISDSC